MEIYKILIEIIEQPEAIQFYKKQLADREF